VSGRIGTVDACGFQPARRCRAGDLQVVYFHFAR
jgi:hypothetical protein